MNTETVKYKAKGQGIDIAIEKAEEGPYWERLLAEKTKAHWLKVRIQSLNISILHPFDLHFFVISSTAYFQILALTSIPTIFISDSNFNSKFSSIISFRISQCLCDFHLTSLD